MVEKPKRNPSRRIIALLIGGALSCVALISAIVALALFLTNDVADAGSDFMTALKDGDFTAAYNLLTPALQDEIGGLDGLTTMVREFNLQPVSWSFNSREIQNNTGRLWGSATFANGDQGDVQLQFLSVDDSWKINAFDFSGVTN